MSRCDDLSGVWQRKAARERGGRLAAETLLERKSRELYDSQCVVAATSSELDQRIRELEEAKDRAEASSKAKTHFLANMSHEIRTPLNGAIGTLELLRETDLDGQQGELVDTVLRCTDSLLELINSVLDASKMDVGRVTLVSEPCELSQIVAESVGLFAATAASKGVKLELARRPEQPAWVLGDPLRLRQIFSNLIGNAVKFTNEGSVEVLFSQQPLGVGYLAVTVQVSDTGPGIHVGDQDRIFSEFQQVDSSRSRAAGGTGLGLSIARRLARLMRGDITLQSEVGKGSTFTLALLARQVEGVGDAARAAPADTSFEGLSVLVVDDNAQNRLVAARMLSHMGCRVAAASSGPTALQHLESRDFDLVLLDGQMPVMSGDQVARVVRDPRSAVRDHDVPILCVTADVVADRLEHYLASGMDAVLTKPFRKSGLLAKFA
ncbi:MAG: ATP-binding protein [bacterium]|nr:ATP-binding protein [bacterium]